jgi:hypothetical protein
MLLEIGPVKVGGVWRGEGRLSSRDEMRRLGRVKHVGRSRPSHDSSSYLTFATVVVLPDCPKRNKWNCAHVSRVYMYAPSAPN